MDDALVRFDFVKLAEENNVLILVLMDDALVLLLDLISKIVG